MENAFKCQSDGTGYFGAVLKQAKNRTWKRTVGEDRGYKNTCCNNGFTNNGTSGTDGPSCEGEQRMANIKYSDAGTVTQRDAMQTGIAELIKTSIALQNGNMKKEKRH